jgi:uncharacterized protein (DUF1501 family)
MKPRNLDRRSFLEMGAASVLGLGLADLARAQASPRPASKERAVILIYLGGGASQYETYDPKPSAPDEFRGPFGTIRTNVPGTVFGELLPEQAKVADKLAVLRSLHHRFGDHNAAIHLWKTGYPGALESEGRIDRHPATGAAVAHARSGQRRDLPAYVVLNSRDYAPSDGAVYLGAAASPLCVPVDHTTLAARTDALQLARGTTRAGLEGRMALLRNFDTLRRDLDRSGQMADLDAFQHRALDLVLGETAQRALDLGHEPSRLRERYGRTVPGQSLLLARRLVEAGVPFVTINHGGNRWDHHERLVPLMRDELPPVDRAVAALVSDLNERGLLDRVLVVLLTDFGRDRMNTIAGRHHWPDCGIAMLAGGGLSLGQVVGASDRRGQFPAQTPLQPPDVLAMLFRHLEVPADAQFSDFSGRPIPVNNGGHLIEQLL